MTRCANERHRARTPPDNFLSGDFALRGVPLGGANQEYPRGEALHNKAQTCRAWRSDNEDRRR